MEDCILEDVKMGLGRFGEVWEGPKLVGLPWWLQEVQGQGSLMVKFAEDMFSRWKVFQLLMNNEN